MKSYAVLVTVALFVSGCATSPTSSVTGKIIQSGLCEHHATIRYDQPQSTAGYATLGDLHITEETSVVQLRRNIGFGFKWQASGIPDEAEVEFVIRHPKITRPDGKTLESFTEPFSVAAHDGIITSTDCYILSEEHELVAGKWSIAVTFKGKTLVSREFDVRSQK